MHLHIRRFLSKSKCKWSDPNCFKRDNPRVWNPDSVESVTFSWIRNYLFLIRIQAKMKEREKKKNKFTIYFCLNCTENRVNVHWKWDGWFFFYKAFLYNFKYVLNNWGRIRNFFLPPYCKKNDQNQPKS